MADQRPTRGQINSNVALCLAAGCVNNFSKPQYVSAVFQMHPSSLKVTNYIVQFMSMAHRFTVKCYLVSPLWFNCGFLTRLSGSPLCQQVSSRTYADSTKKTTNQELWILLNNINLDTKISEKERKRLLRQFYQAHPEIFNQYFGDSAVSVL